MKIYLIEYEFILIIFIFATFHQPYPLTININLFKQININQMFDKI